MCTSDLSDPKGRFYPDEPHDSSENAHFSANPGHLHCIWTWPPNDDDFPECWRQIKGRFTHEYLSDGGRDGEVSEQHGRHGRRGVWQPRYWEHRIRDKGDYGRYRDYIHLNPVKHGYVDRPEAWAWTTFRRHVRMGWLDPNWPGLSLVSLPANDDCSSVHG